MPEENITEQPKSKKEKSATEALAEVELQIKQAQLEALQLEKQERELNLRDLKQRLAERETRELQLKNDREAQGRTFSQQRANDAFRQSRCSHRKGGRVSPRDLRALSEGGDKDQYAVIKHQMINGDIWVRCLRCGKTWNPPVEDNFYFKGGKNVPKIHGTFDKEQYLAAVAEYNRAVQFPTNNSMSSSVQCRFYTINEQGQEVDAARDYRRNIKDTNLR